MSSNFVNKQTGELVQVAGRGRAEYGASTVRKGTITFENVSTPQWVTATVVFGIPMPDANYETILNADNGYVIDGMTSPLTIFNKTVNGFSVKIYVHVLTSFKVSYTAFKLYSDVEYSNIVNSIPATASSSNKLTTMTEVKTLFTTPVKKLLGTNIPTTWTVHSTYNQLIVVRAQLKDFIPAGYKLYKATMELAWTNGNSHDAYMDEVISSSIALATSGVNKEVEFSLLTRGTPTPGSSYTPWNAYNCIIECIKE